MKFAVTALGSRISQSMLVEKKRLDTFFVHKEVPVIAFVDKGTKNNVMLLVVCFEVFTEIGIVHCGKQFLKSIYRYSGIPQLRK